MPNALEILVDVPPQSTWWSFVPWLLISLAVGLVLAAIVSAVVARRAVGSPAPEAGGLRWVIGAGAFFLALAIYGSFVPWKSQPLEWSAAVEQFHRLPYLNLGVGHRADWVANILLFIPLGFFGVGALTLDRLSVPRRLLAFTIVALLGCLLSLGIEFFQAWFPHRTRSQNDVLAETIGAVLGGLIWLALGQPLAAWLRSYARTRRPSSQLDLALQIYCLGFCLYAVMPLDLTISVSEIVSKYRAGKIQLLPLADQSWSLRGAYQFLSDIVVFIPIGMLAATWKAPLERPLRPLPIAIGLGVALAAGVELAQLLVYSRYTSLDDVLLSAIGITIGARLIAHWRGQPTTVGPLAPSLRQASLCLLLAAVYALAVTVVMCLPFETLITDRGLLRSRYESFFQLPFSRLYFGSEFNAASKMLQDLLFFSPLGVFSYFAVDAFTQRPKLRRLLFGVCLVACGLVALGIEAAQLFLPSKFSDTTDVLLRTIGAGVAMGVTARICARQRFPRPTNPAA